MAPSIQVPMPHIRNLCVPKRHDITRCVLLPISFYPPNDSNEWPRTVGDITDTKMKFYLEYAGPGAIGRILDFELNT
jgi:hypothetical protein